MTKKAFKFLSFWLLTSVLGLVSCSSSPWLAQTNATVVPEKTLVLYNWEAYLPESLITDFKKETGIQIESVYYNSMEEAVTKISNEQIQYDLAVVDNERIAGLVTQNKIALIDLNKITNFVNISPSFRDLALDPGNQHSIPYNWGTTGILYHKDRTPFPITSWRDLWEPRLRGHLAIRKQPTELASIALKAWGYSMHSTDLNELYSAYDHLEKLAPSVKKWLDSEDLAAVFQDEEIYATIGWSGDGILVQKKFPNVDYILPAEGTILWGDSFIISAHSEKDDWAELFINFMLRPENSALVVNECVYASANELAKDYILPEYLDNPILFPPLQNIKNGEWYFNNTPGVQKRHQDFFEVFFRDK